MCRLLAVLILFGLGAVSAAETPNILIILADDLGIGDASVYNPDSKIHMTALNALAKDSLRFTDMHTPSAVCTPTRYGLMTGRYCWRSSLKKGVLYGYSPALIEPKRQTLASMLKDKGYETACFGKWHLGLGTEQKTDYDRPLNAGPITVGFDTFAGIPASLDMDPYVWIRNDRAEIAPTATTPGGKHQREGGNGFWRAGPMAPGFEHSKVLMRATVSAMNFIEARPAPAAKPFFVYVPLTAPHTPWLPEPGYAGKSQVGAYGDFCEQTDNMIRGLLDVLTRTGHRDDTLVIVTSDNGSHWPEADIKKWDHRANAGWRGQKSDIHEGGHRVPFLVRWPGKIAPGVTDQTACLTDVFATLAAIVGADIPKDTAEDSYNLKPLLDNPALAEPIHDATIHHSGDGMFAIRMGDWKLIEGLGTGGFTAPARVKPAAGDPEGQLYNLKDDPAETKNLYATQPDVVARLMKRLNEIRNSGRSRP